MHNWWIKLFYFNYDNNNNIKDIYKSIEILSVLIFRGLGLKWNEWN